MWRGQLLRRVRGCNMITAAQLIALFEIMLKEKWKYVWGSAKKGVVDCSGAFVYAFKQYGQSIYHGSNTIYRQYLTQRGKVGQIELVPGMAVFKWREDGEPDKYIADGLDDFYHIGLYVGNDRVLEARGTKVGFVESPLKGWTHAGRLKGVDYSGQKGGEAEMDIKWIGKVTGGRLALRNAADKAATIVMWIPDGQQVKVLEKDAPDGWAYVEYVGKWGYVMVQYMQNVEDMPDGSPKESTDKVTFALSRAAAEELMAALQGQI